MVTEHSEKKIEMASCFDGGRMLGMVPEEKLDLPSQSQRLDQLE
jgi:hypothetical protein